MNGPAATRLPFIIHRSSLIVFAMPRLLALEWNDSEARLAVAATRGDRVVFEEAFSIDLRPGSAEAPKPDAGERIATAMAARSIGRLDTLVAIGRSSLELRQFSLPPAMSTTASPQRWTKPPAGVCSKPCRKQDSAARPANP